jgi:hypothetical protein
MSPLLQKQLVLELKGRELLAKVLQIDPRRLHCRGILPTDQKLTIATSNSAV